MQYPQEGGISICRVHCMHTHSRGGCGEMLTHIGDILQLEVINTF